MADDHIPVLAAEVLAMLDPRPGETCADATAGLGGHAALIGGAIGARGTVILNDLDPGNLVRAAAAVRGPRVVEICGSFAALPDELTARGLAADMVLADLGFSSNQVDDAARGLSFRLDGPLDMRLDPSGLQTAADLVNTLPEPELADVIYRYGEERASRRIAAAIVRRRRQSVFSTTGDLADVVRRAVPGGMGGRIDPATRTFQAIRIAVNGEIDALEALLAGVERAARSLRAGRPAWLRPGARVAVISFHSLEDRPVKHAMRTWEQAGLGVRLPGQPVVAGEEETSRNPRARSAKLRGFTVWSGGDEGVG